MNAGQGRTAASLSLGDADPCPPPFWPLKAHVLQTPKWKTWFDRRGLLCCKRWTGIRSKLLTCLRTCSTCVLPISVKGFFILPATYIPEPSWSPSLTSRVPLAVLGKYTSNPTLLTTFNTISPGQATIISYQDYCNDLRST